LVRLLTLFRPRITININAAGEELDQELLTLELPDGSTIADLKSFVEVETQFPAQSQHFYLNGQALRSDTQTLEQAGVKDGEMMALLVNRRSAQDQGQLRQLRPQQEVDRPEPDAARIEATRQRLLNDPASMTQLIQQQPLLAQAIDNPARFRQTWMGLRDAQEREQRERENQHRLLNDDPFNPDAQKRIEEMIRRERIEANRQYAYENNPAGESVRNLVDVELPNAIKFSSKSTCFTSTSK
jgi:DNA damage-inducible protein 1